MSLLPQPLQHKYPLQEISSLLSEKFKHMRTNQILIHTLTCACVDIFLTTDLKFPVTLNYFIQVLPLLL